MPGQPIFQKLRKDIQEIGGEEWFFEQVADSRPIYKIAKQFGISRSLIYRWLKACVVDYPDKLRAARLLAAHNDVEDGLKLIDESDGNSSSQVQKAKEQAGYRRWLAGVRNRKDYGETSKAPLIALNINALHLDALKAVGITQAALEPGTQAALPPGVSTVPEEGEYEIVEGE